MLPIRDENPVHTFPIVTIVIIALNVVAFLFWEPTLGTRGADEQTIFFFCHSEIPWEITHQTSLAEGGEAAREEIAQQLDLNVSSERFQNILAQDCGHKVWWESIFVAMFLHGGWLHIGGNMLFLWIFGNNVEDRLGPIRLRPVLPGRRGRRHAGPTGHGAEFGHPEPRRLGRHRRRAGRLHRHVPPATGADRRVPVLHHVPVPPGLGRPAGLVRPAAVLRRGGLVPAPDQAGWRTSPTSAGSCSARCWPCCSFRRRDSPGARRLPGRTSRGRRFGRRRPDQGFPY